MPKKTIIPMKTIIKDNRTMVKSISFERDINGEL